MNPLKQKTPSLSNSLSLSDCDPGESSLGKRRRFEGGAPSLLGDPFNPKPRSWPQYLVVKFESSEKASLSCFSIQRALIACGAGEPLAVNFLRSGDLLIKVRTPTNSDALLATTTFSGLPVTVSAHKSLNSSKGVVKSRELQHSTEEEMVQEIPEVIQARRVKLKRDGKEIVTNTWVLTFDSPRPPSFIKAAYLQLEVRPYVPNPMRCYGCQRFGHTKANCRRKVVCGRCGKEGHEEAGCKAPHSCPNCHGDHAASSKDCEVYRQEKAILSHRAVHGGTFAQARTAVFPSGTAAGQTYAKVVASRANRARPNSSKTAPSAPS